MTQAYVDDGILVNSEEFSGMNSKEAREAITNKLEKMNIGNKK